MTRQRLVGGLILLLLGPLMIVGGALVGRIWEPAGVAIALGILVTLWFSIVGYMVLRGHFELSGDDLAHFVLSLVLSLLFAGGRSRSNSRDTTSSGPTDRTW